MTKIEKLQRTNKNIFTTNDLMILWNTSERRSVIESVKDYLRRGRLFSPRRGVYVINKEYNKYELAQKLISPSYISYYTALAHHGNIFQHYVEIHCMGIYSKKIKVNGQTYIYHKCKPSILMNEIGLIKQDNYTIASAERAVCDSLFLNKNIAFDNIRSLDKNKLQEISLIYKNKRLVGDIKRLIKQI